MNKPLASLLSCLILIMMTAPLRGEDNTHFNALGACRMADLAAAEIRSKVPGLAKWLRD